MKCPHCGANIYDEINRCQYCGSYINQNRTPSQSPEQHIHISIEQPEERVKYIEKPVPKKTAPSKKKKRIKLWQVILFILILSALSNGGTKKNSSTSSTAPDSTVSAVSTAFPTTAKADTKKEILLRYPQLGEYGQYYTFNETVEKATDEDRNTVIQCFVPAGDYIVTNEGKYITDVNVYSEKTVITEEGWEEPADAYIVPQLQPGASSPLTIREGYYIQLLENDVFRLVRQ